MDVVEKQYDAVAEQRSVVQTPEVQERQSPSAHPIILNVAAASQSITPWGTYPKQRDKELRSFWISESWLASVVYSVTIRNASFAWEVVGADPAKPAPRNTIRAVERLLKKANRGKGWKNLIIKTCIDLYTVDNGAFWEIIRKDNRDPRSPVINIAHMDSVRCLSGDSRVLFEDGSTMSIREVVRHKYGGYVMSVGSSGQLEPKRITNFYESPLGDRYWIQLRLENPKRSYGKSEQLTLTNDHEILTKRGWLPAEQVTVGDKVATDYIQPSKEQYELLIGSLLGDGYLSKNRRKSHQMGHVSSFQVTHAAAQEEWVDTKIKALQDFGWSKKRKTSRDIVSANTAGSPALGALREHFYRDSTKIFPLQLVKQHLSPRLLAAWYLDDGNKHTGQWGRPKGRLYTNNYSVEEVIAAVDMLNEYGISCKMHVTKAHTKNNKKYGPYYYIYITADGFETLCEQIAPYIPESMRYKLSEDADQKYPYNPALWELSSEIYYDTIVATSPVNNGEQTATFCIDVEDNHNFVAAGMVVHNCTRTGDPEYPVIYEDRYGKETALGWWQVRTLEEFPSPVENAFDIQVSAVSRALLAAEIIQSISVYKMEKVSGNFTRAIDAVSGVTQQNIDDALEMAEEQNLNRGLYRFSLPVIIPGVDPTSTLSHIHIDLASLPDNFNEDTSFKWYVAQLAAAFGVDYQEIAPLMTGNLGSSQQSEIMHLKTRGKGPALIMGLFEDIINDGLIPGNVEFRFLEQDLRSETEKANARFTRAKDRAMRLKSGELDPEAARQLAIEDGDLPRWLADEIDERGVAQNTEEEFGAEQIMAGIESREEDNTGIREADNPIIRESMLSKLLFEDN